MSCEHAAVVPVFGAALLLCENSTCFWPCHSDINSTSLSFQKATSDLVLTSVQALFKMLVQELLWGSRNNVSISRIFAGETEAK